jgi:S1-C subfamily serine protease
MSGRLNGRSLPRRSGLTLPELLVAILLFGTTGALLLPHLVSVAPSEPAASGQRFESCTPVPYGSTDRVSTPEFAERGFIGVMLRHNPTPDGYVCVNRPFPGGPAERAGLRPLDVILRVDGASARNKGWKGLQRMLTNGQPRTPVRLTVRRAGVGTFDLRVIRSSFFEVFLPGIAGG